MDKEETRKSLAEAEDHIRRTKDLLKRQAANVANLQLRGLDATEATLLLKNLEELHTAHEADRERLLEQLGKG